MSNSRNLGYYFFYSLFIIVILLNSSCLKTQGIIKEDTNQSRTDAVTEVISETEMLPDPNLYFRITVIDEETKRGIPLVKLTTLSGVNYYTDSAGVVAFFEQGLMNREVFFHIESDGYSIEKDPYDGFGKILNVVSGGSTVIEMKRENIAQRLYRITGSGIYYDSVLLGDRVPIDNPIINSSVIGQDSTLVAIYEGKLFWVWGDTSHPRHPLGGSFKVTCATSLLPSDGGLDPEIGVNINYFTEGDFIKQMVPLPGTYAYWLDSLISIKDKTGKERLIANYAKVQPVMETVGRGIVEFNDEKQVFEEIAQNPLDAIIQPNSHPFKCSNNGDEYYYFPSGSKFSRAKADYDSLIDHSTYEAFTCLKEGSRFNCTKEQLDRNEDGSLRYSWKENTSPIGQKEQNELVAAGLISPDEKWFQLIDIDNGKNIIYHNGSIYWNPYRNRWIMILNEAFGTSFLGEIWYAEGDTPLGPWTYAKKVVTHNDYSFYNPVQHPHFMKEDGRVIFFEGTYTKSFSGTEISTPRYDYNQIMYKLELDDPRLILPVPVYKFGSEKTRYLTDNKIPKEMRDREIVFFALDRKSESTVPVYEIQDKDSKTSMLTILSSDKASKIDATIAFYALPPNSDYSDSLNLPLYEYVNKQTQKRVYSTEESMQDSDYERIKLPICIVWKKPTNFNPFKCDN